MERLSFDYAHTLSLAKARAKASTAARALCASHSLKMTVTEGRIHLDGSLLHGHIDVHKGKASVSVTLAGEVTPTADSVEAVIRKALDRQFG